MGPGAVNGPWNWHFLDQIPEKTNQEFAACYLNNAAKLGKGVMITYKRKDLPNDVGVLDLEKGRMNQLTEYTWLTDDTNSLGRWRV